MSISIKMDRTDVIIAFAVIGLLLLVFGLVLGGYITTPMTIGLILALGVIAIFTGSMLVERGYISKQALPLYYTFILGVSLIVFGLVHYSQLPLLAYFMIYQLESEILTTAIYVAIIVVIVVALMLALRKKSIYSLKPRYFSR